MRAFSVGKNEKKTLILTFDLAITGIELPVVAGGENRPVEAAG